MARAAGRHGVLRIPEARWLRWFEGVLEVGDAHGRVEALLVPPEALTFVGRALASLSSRPMDGCRLAVSARFPGGATVLVDQRPGRCAVAASPLPRGGRQVAGARPRRAADA